MRKADWWSSESTRPEFEFEKRLENLSAALEELSIEYPVVQDNDFTIWRAFDNQFWPAKYLIDGQGTVRYLRHGEGAYEETEDKIRELLTEAGFDVAAIPTHTEPPRSSTRASGSYARPGPA